MFMFFWRKVLVGLQLSEVSRMILHALFSKKSVFNQTSFFLDFFFGDLPLGRHQLFLRDNLGFFLNMWLMGLMAYPMDDICVWSLFDVF